LPKLKAKPERERYGVCAPIPDASEEEAPVKPAAKSAASRKPRTPR
jgi:hypothetical protein